MLMTDLIQEYSETAVGLLSHIGMDNVRRVAQRLTCQAVDALDRGGFAPADRSIEWGTSLRYFGQEHTLDTPLEEEDDIESLCRRFDALHKQRYGHTMTDPVQLVHVRVRGIGRTPRPKLRTIPRRNGAGPLPRASREAFCFAQRSPVKFAVYDRSTLCAGDVVQGPAIVEENTTTLVFFLTRLQASTYTVTFLSRGPSYYEQAEHIGNRSGHRRGHTSLSRVGGD